MLSGSAIRQFAWIVIKTSGGDTAGLVTEVTNKRRKYAALRELEAAGLILVIREKGKASKYAIPTNNMNTNNIYISGSDIEGTSRQNRLPPGRQNRLPVDETGYDQKCLPVDENVYGYESLEDEAEDIDSMPQDGRDTPQRAHTLFRTRRERQRKFVQRTWEEIYPKLPPLIDANANEFLKLCDESAVMTLSIFRQFEGSSKACFRYLRKVAENKQAERAKQTEGTISPALGSEKYPGWESDEAYHAFQAKQLELKELAIQMGYDYGDE